MNARNAGAQEVHGGRNDMPSDVIAQIATQTKYTLHGVGMASTENKRWTDDEIDKIPVNPVKHLDDERNLALFTAWLGELATNPKDPDAFFQNTVYIALQLRSPRDHTYVFEAEPTPGPSNRPSYRTSLAGDDKIDVAHLITPVLAAFMLRCVYRSQFEPSTKSTQFNTQACRLYGIVPTSHPAPTINALAAEVIRSKGVAGSIEMNSVLVRYLKAAVADEGGPVSGICDYSILLHSKWNGMAVVGRLYQICLAYNKTPEFFLIAGCFFATAKIIRQVEEFMDRTLLSANPQRYVPWARALSNAYETELSNQNTMLVIMLWSFLIEPSGTEGVWTSNMFRNVAPGAKMVAKYLAALILKVIESIDTATNATMNPIISGSSIATPMTHDEVNSFMNSYAQTHHNQLLSGITPRFEAINFIQPPHNL
ncbi:hypothetical protein 1 [Shayang ascaridia galli virus 2]|uniref:Nucleoprotein n=1 Tax=Shayang ascaridia galli virus 2 TaxID=1923460 RepID=A0A1L3KMT4_9RHAB|nr:hypothetical protein 1 [Shayang ascaridia galli virus 2]APG78673.1 hypothetical protein 1 [Shayang ascaridia galli virus 2]